MLTGSFFALRTRPVTKTSSVSVELLHRAECKACPLNNQRGLQHPKMLPTGSKKPLVYMLGEAPGADEDKRGEQFVGASGRVLRSRIPDEWNDSLRWNNCVRTRPPGNATPGFVEIECCRPSIVRDIEASKPVAIFGFGNVPLNWVIGMNGITGWRGRRLPVKIGNHSCWFFPMFHPSFVMRQGDDGDKNYRETLFTFELDLKNAFAAIESLPEPIVHSKDDARDGVEFTTDDVPRVLEFINSLYDEKVVGVDFETKGVRPYASTSRLLTAALAGSQGSMAFSLAHPSIEEALVKFLRTASCRKAVHHVGFELEWAAYHWGKDIVRAGHWECTMSQAFILDERKFCFGLDFLTALHFGLNIKSLANLDKNNLDKEPLDEVLMYNGIDAKYHRLLYLQQRRLLKEQGLLSVYREHMKRPATMVLTQLLGLPVDQDVVREFTEHYTKKLKAIERKIQAMPEVGKFTKKFQREFRPSANADIKDAVHHIIGTPIDKVDEKTLVQVKHALPRAVLRWRHFNKVLSTYVKPVTDGSQFVFPDGKLHPVVMTTSTVTWRTSTDSPSIQNWPKRNGEQKEVRKQIRPRPGKRGARKLVSFDYGQIQARNVAMESQDKTLIKAFWDDYDIHEDWMWRIARAYPDWVPGGLKSLDDKDTRKAKRHGAKNAFVFPLFFGAGATTIAYYLGIPVEYAEPLREQFWDMFPGVRTWHERVKKFYFKHGYVTGLTGFRRRAPVAINELINAPIQADEAAIVCDAMYRLSLLGLQAIMEIHDSLDFLWYESDIDKKAETVVGAMLNCPFEWAKIVPLSVEMSVGDDWYEMKDVGVYSSKDWGK